jgi:hypothetical protein
MNTDTDLEKSKYDSLTAKEWKKLFPEIKLHLNRLNQRLLDLDTKGAGSRATKNILEDVYCTVHSIKGLASYGRSDMIVALAHSAEHMLNALLKGEIRLNDTVMKSLFAFADLCDEMLNHPAVPDPYRFLPHIIHYTRDVSGVLAGKGETSWYGPMDVFHIVLKNQLSENDGNTIKIMWEAGVPLFFVERQRDLDDTILHELFHDTELVQGYIFPSWIPYCCCPACNRSGGTTRDVPNRFLLASPSIPLTRLKLLFTPLLRFIEIPPPPDRARAVSANLTISAAQHDLIRWKIGEGNNVFIITITFSHGTVMRSATSLVIMNMLKKGATVLLAAPSEEAICRGEAAHNFKLVISTSWTYQELERILDSFDLNCRIEIRNYSPPIDGTPLQQTYSSTGENASAETNPMYVEENDFSAIEKSVQTMSGRVKTELSTIRKNTSEGSGENEFARFRAFAENMERFLDDMDAELCRIKMITVEALMCRFPRMVRDLAESMGKEVDFSCNCNNMRLSRYKSGFVKRALIHLVRNAIDHGIAPPRERTESGKPEKGKVEITFSIEKGILTIQVSDDGEGLIKEEKPVSNYREGTGGNHDDSEKLPDVIFKKGYSTKANPDQVSGRGLGLHIAREEIKKLGGEVSVESTSGKGTVFYITVPDDGGSFLVDSTGDDREKVQRKGNEQQ